MHFFSINLRRALDEYYDFLRKFRSENTFKLYSHVLDQMVEFLDPASRLRAITSDELDQAVGRIITPDHADATAEIYKRVINTFFNHMVEAGHLKTSPVSFTVKQIIRPPTDTSKAIPDEDIARMLAACLNARDRALVIFFRDTAFRLGGAWNLRLEGLDFRQRWVTSLEIKNDRRDRQERHTVPMSDPLADAMQAWLAERAEKVDALPADHGYVFTRHDTGQRLKYWGVFSVMRRLGHRAKVKRFSPHKFRHAWGVWAARTDVSLPKTQAQMGHKSPRTTAEYYYKVPSDSMREAVNERAQVMEGQHEDA